MPKYGSSRRAVTGWRIFGSANALAHHRRLTAPCKLQNGDLIQIGASTLRFEMLSRRGCGSHPAPLAPHQLLEKYVIMLVTDIRN